MAPKSDIGVHSDLNAATTQRLIRVKSEMNAMERRSTYRAMEEDAIVQNLSMENQLLIRSLAKKNQELQNAKSVIKDLLTKNVAFARTMRHLTEAWKKDPEEIDIAVNKKLEELNATQEVANKNNEHIERMIENPDYGNFNIPKVKKKR